MDENKQVRVKTFDSSKMYEEQSDAPQKGTEFNPNLVKQEVDFNKVYRIELFSCLFLIALAFVCIALKFSVLFSGSMCGYAALFCILILTEQLASAAFRLFRADKVVIGEKYISINYQRYSYPDIATYTTGFNPLTIVFAKFPTAVSMKVSMYLRDGKRINFKVYEICNAQYLNNTFKKHNIPKV